MNQKLPVVTARDAIRALERAGFVASRTSGSHCCLVHGSDQRGKSQFLCTAALKRGTFARSLRRQS